MTYAMGVDIGGTTVKGGVVENNRILFKSVRPLNKRKPLDTLCKVIEDLLTYDEKPQFIAIATAGRVDSDKGLILYASPNVPNWSGLSLSRIIENQYKVPCFVLNDARAAALAEARSRNVSNLVLLTIGTGLGGGIVLNNQLVFGHCWEAGEMGHTILRPNGRTCNCGKKGCAETYISMKILHKYSHEKDRKRLIDRFKQGDAQVVLAVEKVCEDLAILVDRIFLTLDPEVVVVGGGFCELGLGALEILRKHVRIYSDKSLYKVSQIDFSVLGNDAGIIGAAIHAQERLLGSRLDDR
ncbi:ROK family protein [Pseudothermotoga sp. U03pept]|uniref:ROK family protein n=1 Tax=Pseudothermotoga sp. U03pept TaxID=3447012 RepID=UPI003F089DD2